MATENIVAPISGYISIEGEYVSVVSSDGTESVKMTGFEKTVPDGKYVSTGEVIGKNPKNFKKWAYLNGKSIPFSTLSGEVEPISSKTNSTDTSKSTDTSIMNPSSDEKIALDMIKLGVGAGLPQLAFLNKVTSNESIVENDKIIENGA